MPHRDAVVGYFLFTTIVSVIALEFISAQYSGIANLLTWVAIASGWAAAALLLHRTRVAQRASVALMILVGVAALLVVRSKGVDAPWQAAVFQSLPLVTMIMSVGFLKRIVLSAMAAEAPLPVGSTAFRDTALAIALFGSFINISVAIMVGDRLSRHEPLGHYNAAAITRAFSTCVNWSPFFAGLAVVISYSPSFSLPIVMLQGVPLALMGLFVITVLARRNPAALAKFRGFPIKWTSLWIPTVLAITVLSLRYLLPALALLPVIALSALLVVIITLCVSHGVARAARTMHQHIVTDLPLSFNELTLLLGVGVLAAGLVAWVNLGLLQWQPPEFTGVTAALVLAAMILIAMVGFHPVITIALATSLLAPVQPNPELLATTLLLGWSLGTLACPLSGMHLVMQGRFGVSSLQAAIGHWPYVGMMFVLGVVWLQCLALLYL